MKISRKYQKYEDNSLNLSDGQTQYYNMNVVKLCTWLMFIKTKIGYQNTRKQVPDNNAHSWLITLGIIKIELFHFSGAQGSLTGFFQSHCLPCSFYLKILYKKTEFGEHITCTA